MKLKICDGCNQPKPIWKSSGTGGKRYCRQCWSCQPGNVKPQPTGRHKPIPPRSLKRSKEEKIYAGKRMIFLQEHPMCEAHLPGCLQLSSQVHHKSGRVGDKYLDVQDWLAVCPPCHQHIENNPVESKALEFSKERINQ